MHSYSLMKFDTFFRRIRPDPGQLRKLRALLSTLMLKTGCRDDELCCFRLSHSGSTADFSLRQTPSRNGLQLDVCYTLV